MKKYQSCEVKITVLKELDVITASLQGTNVSNDYFGDVWWTVIGGEES